LVKDPESVEHMTANCQIGDIIDVIVTEDFDLLRSQSLGERPIINIVFNFQRGPVNQSFNFLGCL
jgi:hypothetical protein